MEAIAKLRNNRGSARKARLVADLVRNKNVEKAFAILDFTNKGATEPIKKLLRSAVANWENKNAGLSAEDNDLYIKTITVDSGATMKRFRPAPMGRAYRIRKRLCHITIVVDSKVPAVVADDVKEDSPAETQEA